MVTIQYSKSVVKQSPDCVKVETQNNDQQVDTSRETYISVRRSLREELKDIKRIQWDKTR